MARGKKRKMDGVPMAKGKKRKMSGVSAEKGHAPVEIIASGEFKCVGIKYYPNIVATVLMRAS